MPHNEEQHKRRQEKREAQRKKQQAESRRLKRTLFLAVLVLIACGFGIYKLTQNPPGEAEQVQAVETKPAETTKPTRPIDKDPITKIHIKAAGDLNVTTRVVDSGLAVSGYDYSPVFKDVAAILADADLTVMNFEGNVCGEPYGSETTSAPIQLLHALRGCGVDLLQMANSCAINNGLNGLTATLQSIRSAGMEPLGAYATESELRTSKGYTMTEIQGIKVAFVAFTKGLGGRGMPAGSEGLVNLLYKDYATTYKEIDREGITSILKNVAAEKPDITVAMLHWGSEYNDDISKTQDSIVNLMQEQGVDIILGTHPHTLQPIVFDENAGTLVVYSLGDFFGDAVRGATNYSIILDIEITKDANAGTTKVTDYTYTPIYTVTETESIGNDDRKVVRISKAIEANQGNFLDKINETCKANMEYALVRIGERVATTEEVDCPDCNKVVSVLVNKAGTLVNEATCKNCKAKLPAGSSMGDYD